MSTRILAPLIATLFAPMALAQTLPTPPEVDVQRYHPTIDSRKTLWTESAGSNVGSDAQGIGRLVLHYVNSPLVWQTTDGSQEFAIVSDVLTLNAIAGVGYDRLRIGVDVPIYLVAAGDQALNVNGAGLGDLGIDGRITALDSRDAPIGLGLSGRLYLPTSTVQTSLGSSGPVGEIQALVDADLKPIYLAANFGERVSPTTALSDTFDVGNQFLAKLGGAYSFEGTDAGISLDANTNINLGPVVVDGSLVGIPVELLLGGWYRVNDQWVLRGGAGRGVTAGVGSPTARAVVSIAYEPPLEGDADADGIMDLSDACPNVPEDIDNFEDENGCPDEDNDQDGIVDADDLCPMRAEDIDNWEDEDGCPDPSTAVVFKVLAPDDTEMTAATVQIVGPEKAAGAEGMEAMLHPGKYTVHAVAAGYPKTSLDFEVPADTEVVVRMATVPGTLAIRAVTPGGALIPGATYTLDGRPGNALADGTIEGPSPPGDHELIVRAEGYAPFKQDVAIEGGGRVEVVAVLNPSKIKMTREKIDIKDQIFFDTGKATIKPVSFALLDEVSQIVLDYPEIQKLRIEGHTDARGSDVTNQKLSEERAASVLKYLSDQGIAGDRLISIGYGESKPLVQGNNAAAWDKNRRVEFFVEVWDADAAPER